MNLTQNPLFSIHPDLFRLVCSISFKSGWERPTKMISCPRFYRFLSMEGNEPQSSRMGSRLPSLLATELRLQNGQPPCPTPVPAKRRDVLIKERAELGTGRDVGNEQPPCKHLPVGLEGVGKPWTQQGAGHGV